ncbi:MAG: hypothetical protein A3B30_00095 [Candidatus Komeilibacteria bacterium RIFCSPLOWO2_01_FULL_52_15]|uniref:Uncharacterized protein n=2 Tax=Candidatus Komeiliibacteriota TaxID=1817908 RepID=A0A1G2BNB6_9BACT|nr:MAG: hypothetical protein A2677_00170 [Candidatus Komeilibacteria bacterium RIFCSPHIGHO2_01_FULL_52_14]OGY90601.1 MAG: hypothetical protein A3B30_00095 [Candidatus Komeilibacteria bacterium RIFCSPLOWO2_01_FULL_52_15]
MASVIVPILAVMLGAGLIVCALMTPVKKVSRPKVILAAVFGLSGLAFVIAGILTCCFLALR